MVPEEKHELVEEDGSFGCSCGYDLPSPQSDAVAVFGRHVGAAWIEWAADDPSVRDEAEAVKALRELAAWVRSSAADATGRRGGG